MENYILDSPYAAVFNSSCTPAQMATMAQARGVVAPQVDKSFRFGDFGCGQGLTLLVLAAAYPDSEFVGLDLNPHHIATARQHAKRAALRNVDFIQGDILDIDPARLGELDFGVAHGVYSWVSSNVRRAVRDLMAATLNPDGLALISYNTQAGYCQMLPVRALLRSLYEHASGSVVSRRQQAIRAMQDLAEAGGPFFLKNPEARAIILNWKNSDPAYLFHEYFNSDWYPSNLSEVVSFMADAGFSFCGDTMLHDQPHHTGSPTTYESVLTEEISSFVHSIPFRSDVFSRQIPSEPQVVRIPDDDHFGLIWPAATDMMQEISTRSSATGRIARVFLDGPLSWREVRQYPEVCELTETEQAALLRHGLATLVITRYAPVSQGRKTSDSRKSVFQDQYSDVLANNPQLLERAPYFPTRRLGGAIPIPPAIAEHLAKFAGAPLENDGLSEDRLCHPIPPHWIPFLTEAGVIQDFRRIQ